MASESNGFEWRGREMTATQSKKSIKNSYKAHVVQVDDLHHNIKKRWESERGSERMREKEHCWQSKMVLHAYRLHSTSFVEIHWNGYGSGMAIESKRVGVGWASIRVTAKSQPKSLCNNFGMVWAIIIWYMWRLTRLRCLPKNIKSWSIKLRPSAYKHYNRINCITMPTIIKSRTYTHTHQ